jgi:hypothetical protein
MAVAHQPFGHVGAHPAQSNHAKFHAASSLVGSRGRRDSIAQAAVQGKRAGSAIAGPFGIEDLDHAGQVPAQRPKRDFIAGPPMTAVALGT